MPKAQGPEPIDLNILPEQYRPRVTPPIIRIVWLVALALAVLLVPGLVVAQSVRGQSRQLSANVRQARATLQIMRTPMPEMTELSEEMERWQLAAEAIDVLQPTVTARQRDWVPVLDAMLQYDSGRIQLLTLFQDGDDVSLAGLARSQDDVLRYAGDLDASGAFQRVIVQSIELSDQPLTAVPHPSTLVPRPGDGTPVPPHAVTPGIPGGSYPGADVFYDRYEIDDHDPKPIMLGEQQWRNFNPVGDIDQAALTGRAGAAYCVQAVPRVAGARPLLQVTVNGQATESAECRPGELVGQCVCPTGAAEGALAAVASVQIPGSGDAQVTIRVSNRGEYGPDSWYTLQVYDAVAGPPPAETPSGVPPGVSGDPFEPDDLRPVPISPGESQRRTFYPAGDVDRVEIAVRAGYTYEVRTSELAPGVDTVISVLVHGAFYRHESVSPSDLSSRVVFAAAQNGVAGVSITNRGLYGPDKAYTVTVVETAGIAAPGQTATAVAFTPSPSATILAGTPTPYGTPGPTPTPTLNCGDVFEPDDTVPRFMVPGSVQARTFCPTGDRDRAVFTAKAGRRYRIETVGLASGVDTVLSVQFLGATYGNDDRAPGDLGSSVDIHNRSTSDAPVFITVVNKGLYGPAMRYDLRVLDISGGMDDAFEPDDLSGVEIRPGTPQQRTFNPEGDVDKVFFLAAPHHVYRVYTSNLAAGVDTHLTVEMAGRRLEHDNRSGTDLSSFIEFQNHGAHHTGVIVTIRNLGDYGPDKWYMIHVDNLGEGDRYEPDDVDGAPILMGAPQQRAFHPQHDVDKVYFSAQPYRRYAVQTYNLAAGVDTVLNVYAGARYEHNDNRAPGDLSSYVSFYHDSPTPVQVMVYVGNKGQFGVSQRYMLRVDDLGGDAGDDYEPDLEVKRHIAPGEIQRRTFDPQGDIDQVVLLAYPGKRYAVMTCGSSAMPPGPVTSTNPFVPADLVCEPLMNGVDTIIAVTGPVQQCEPATCLSDDVLPDSAYTNSRVEFAGLVGPGVNPVEVTIRVYNKGTFGPSMIYYIRAHEIVSSSPAPTATATPWIAATWTPTPVPPTATPTTTPIYPGPITGVGLQGAAQALGIADAPLSIRPLLKPEAQEPQGEATVRFMLLLKMRQAAP